MSEKLYKAVQEGRIRPQDLNDEGKKALRMYIEQKNNSVKAPDSGASSVKSAVPSPTPTSFADTMKPKPFERPQLIQNIMNKPVAQDSSEFKELQAKYKSGKMTEAEDKRYFQLLNEKNMPNRPQTELTPYDPAKVKMIYPRSIQEYKALTSEQKDLVSPQDIVQFDKDEAEKWWREGSVRSTIFDNVFEPFSRGVENLLQSNPVGRTIDRATGTAAKSLQQEINPEFVREQQRRGRMGTESTGNEVVDNIADFVGQTGAMFFPVGGPGSAPTSIYNAPGVQNLAARAGSKFGGLGSKVASEVVKEGVTGAVSEAAFGLARGEDGLDDLAKNAAIGGGLGVASGAAVPLIGTGIRKAASSVADRVTFGTEVDDFIRRVNSGEPITAYPEGRIVREAGSGNITKTVDDAAERFNPSPNQTAADQMASASQPVISRKGRKPLMLNESTPEGIQAMNISGSVDETAQNYAGNNIPFRQVDNTQTNRTISRTQVVRNMKKNLGVVIDTGRMSTKSKGVLGQYSVKPEVVRTRMAEDLQVLSHEIGHHLDKKFGLNDKQFKKELINLLQHNPQIDLKGYDPKHWHGEGIAEYMRLFMTDPDQAKQLAPKFSEYLQAKLDRKTWEGLLNTQRDIDTWLTQGEYEQAKGLIDFNSGKGKERFNWNKFYTRFVDDLHPVKLAEMALKGTVEVGKKSAYKMARLSRGTAERAKLAITRGIYDDSGNKISNGLREIVAPLKQLDVGEEDFATYLAVKHAVDLKSMGKNVPFTDGQIQAVLKRLDTPEVQAIHKGILEYNNRLLDVLVEAQILSRDAVDAMKQKYPNYVPFMRHFEEDVEAGFKNGGFGAAKGFANIANPVRTMSEEGSFRTIINPLESMVKNTFLVMNAASKNKVGLQLADLAKIDGAGAWIERVPGGASAKEHVINVWQNGKRQAYKIREPELYNAMLSLDNESSNSLIKFLGGAAGMLRAGATLTPEFTIRNAMRDIVSATINSSKYGFNPIDFFKGMFHVLGRTETFDKFLSSGGAMGTMQSLDRDATREAMGALIHLSIKDKAMNVVTDPKELAKLLTGYTPAKKVVGGLRKAAEISELSTKVGAFNKTLKKTGSIEEAAYTARDLMDFNRAGSSVRQANRAVAFLNASIQGTDKMVRAFKENPAAFTIRAFTTLALPSVALYYWTRNLDPEKKAIYDNIPQWQKDAFFIIPGPGDSFFRIPKPFETGMLFATGTERLLRWMEENDPEAFNGYGRSAAEALTPPVLFTALTPLLEATTNHSFFRNAPIVPMGDQRFEKKDQYGLYTSETAKAIGEFLSHTPLKDSNFASPRIIDNTIKGYTAGLGQYAIDGLDEVIKPLNGKEEIPLPAKKWTEDPFFRSFFATTSGGGQIRQDFYDTWDKISKEKASAERNEIPYNNPEYKRMKSAKSMLDKVMKQYKITQTSKDVNSEQKRLLLDELDAKMNDIAAKGLGK